MSNKRKPIYAHCVYHVAIVPKTTAREFYTAGDIEKSTAAMEKMSTEGLSAFISILEESIKRKMG